MKNITLPKRQLQSTPGATNQYNHLYVAAKYFRSKKEFIFHANYQIHPSVQAINNWDEPWFSNYE